MIETRGLILRLPLFYRRLRHSNKLKWERAAGVIGREVVRYRPIHYHGHPRYGRAGGCQTLLREWI